MRFVELELLAYGPFTGRKLDFSHEGPSVHLIYGSNEAGKSTTLRAALGLLYGIEDRTADDYVHGRADLRIAARLRSADGQVLAVCRRKGKKDTLLTEDGRPLDEAVLQRVLGGIPEALFRLMFGLDHTRLRQGGEQLRSGQGDLGESLFQAGAGASSIHRVLSALTEEADAIFRPRGQRRLNEAIKRYEETRKQVREYSKRAEGFRTTEHELEQNKQKSSELQHKRHALLAERSRLERALRVLPGLAKRRELLARRAALGDLPRLAEDAAAARRSAQAELEKSEAQAMQLEQTIARLRQQRAQLVIPEALCQLNPTVVSRIRMRLGSQQKAAEDLPRVRGELRTLERAATAALRSLGSPLPLEEVESLEIDSPTQTRIAKLAHEHSGLTANLLAAERDLAAADAQIAQATDVLATFEPRRTEPASLLPARRLPSEAAVKELRQRFDRLERAFERDEETAAREHEREQRVLLELGTLEREGAPPTEQELTQARAERDHAWQELKRVFSARSEPAAGLAERYERLVRQGDELGDRIRREASRVSRLAALLSEQASVERERARLSAKQRERETERARLATEWESLWSEAGLVPRAPAEMESMLAKVASLMEAGRRGRTEAEYRLAIAKAALAHFELQWSELMARLGLASSASAQEAREVLEARRALLERASAMTSLRSRIEGMERDSAQLQEEVTSLIQSYVPELSGLAFEQAAEELVERHTRARRDVAERDNIDKQMRDDALTLERLKAVADGARAKLGELMRLARVADLQGLEHMEQRSADARMLEQALLEVDNELLDQGEGANVEALVAQTAELLPEHVRARITELSDELDLVNEEHTAAVRNIGSLEAGLELVKSDDRSAEAAAEAEQYLSRIKHEARTYLRTKLAAELLSREITRYRDQNQGPIVGEASQLFARLTLGRYPKLRVDYDAADELVLKCVDEQGRTVAIESLSDGARDQLYLALRLSSLRLFAERSEPMPLLLDDALIHFDDDRARVALELLAELASVTQVLFFTHHARILELAQQAVPKERLVEHRL